MKTFQDAALAGMAVRGVKFIPKGGEYTEKGVSELVAFLGHARNEVIVVGGGLESSIYEREDVLAQIKRLLARGVSFRILIGPKSEEEFREEHPLLSEVYEKHPGRIEIYSAEKVPRAHFCVIDRKHVSYEEEHPAGAPREVYYEYRHRRLAGRLRQIFDDTIDRAENYDGASK